MRKLLQCHDCKQLFPRDELINYATLTSKTSYNYCKDCYEKKIMREKFRQTVCTIFGLKDPGPRIWNERNRIIEKYGYTDDIIIDCLVYLYNVLQKKHVSESIYLVTPLNVEKMKQYKRYLERAGKQFIRAIDTTPVIEKKVLVRENDESRKKVNWNIDDWLNCE